MQTYIESSIRGAKIGIVGIFHREVLQAIRFRLYNHFGLADGRFPVLWTGVEIPLAFKIGCDSDSFPCDRASLFCSRILGSGSTHMSGWMARRKKHSSEKQATVELLFLHSPYHKT